MNEFSSSCSDEPLAANRRVHEEGREYYERNTKSSGWFAHGNSKADPQPEARLRSDAARDIAMKNRGTMSESMGGYADPAPQRVTHPRAVKPEAQNNASGHNGGAMRNLIDNYGNLEVSARPGPKVKGYEAEEYKQREQGSTKILLDHYSTDPIPAAEQPPQPRLGHGAHEIADKHTGEDMGPLLRLEGGKSSPREPKVGPLHQTSSGGSWDEIPPQNRMRPEGEDIAKKNSADSIGDILLQNNTAIPQRKEAKVLKHLEESPIRNRIPPNRVRQGGMENLEKARNREEMSAIMHGTPNVSVEQPRSGKRVLPHLKRSELW